ncbi:MAG: MTH938/NDUFAF3 family protein [Candidatus Asgardarchaeia archaeon]
MEISSSFGSIIINGKKYTEDVLIDARGAVIKRLKHISSAFKSKYGHTPLTKAELEETLKKFSNITILVIGTGQYGAMPVESDAIRYLESKGIEYIIETTPEAINRFKELANKRKDVLGLFHITC